MYIYESYMYYLYLYKARDPPTLPASCYLSYWDWGEGED